MSQNYEKRSIGYWNPKRIDDAFDKLKEELGRDPSSNEFREKYDGAFSAVIRGRYDPKITKWNDYVKYRTGKINRKWPPEEIDKAYDKMKITLGRKPSYREFKKEHGGALGAIHEGRYDPNITKWSEYLIYRNETPKSQENKKTNTISTRRRRSKIYKSHQTPEIIDNLYIDQSFDQLMGELKRTPRAKDFMERYPRAYTAITQGNYKSGITKWNQYLQHRGVPINRPSKNIGQSQNWSPKNIDIAFDRMKKSLGRRPRYKEFAKECGGAIAAIRQDRYDPNITKWSEYIEYRTGKPPENVPGKWKNPRKIDNAFDKMKDKLGRNPTQTEFDKSYGGAYTAIKTGRYNPNVKNWRQYLAHRGLIKNSNKLTESNFPKAVEINKLLKRAVEVYGSDARNLADIITILYPGQIDRDEAYRLITRPSISQYMGRFLRSGVIPTLEDVKPIVKDVDLDKNKVIHDILMKTGIHYYDSLLGPTPSQKDEQDVLLILQSQIEQEANPSMKKLLEELLKDFKEVYSIRPPGMADRIRRPEPRMIEKEAEKQRMTPLDYLISLVDDKSLVQQATDALYTDSSYINHYQRRGAKYIVDKKRFLIADEVGTGKTLQAVTAKKELDRRRETKTRTLVICPASMKYDWRTKIREYCPKTEDVVILNGYNEKTLNSAKDVDFLITNYEAFGNKQTRDKLTQKLLEMKFDYVVLDEAHHVKNPRAERSKDRIKKIADSAEYLAMLSGTPLPNDIYDAYMMISMLDPKTYPTAEHVRKAHQNNPDAVGSLLRSRMQRWTMKEVFDLPGELKEEYRVIDLDKDHRDVYDTILNYERIYGGEKLDILRKALLDPSLLLPDVKQSEKILEKTNRIFKNKPNALEKPPESSKYKELDKIIEDALSRGEKTVVFTSTFKEGVTEKLQERYAKYGALRIDGNVTGKDKTNVRNEFQTNPDRKVLIATTRTTGEGISLTAARNVVFLDEPYTSTEREQAIGRAYRRGQKGDVNVITLIGKNTVDEGVRKLLEHKEQGIQRLIDGVPYKEFKQYLKALSKGVNEQEPITDVIYTPKQTNRQKLVKHFSQMEGKSIEQIRKYMSKYGDDIAELYAELWEGSYSENAAKIYRQIIKAVEEKEGKLAKKADIGSGPAILSRVTGEPTINIDANPGHFKKAKEITHPDNDYLLSFLQKLPLKSDVLDLALYSLSLYYTKLDEDTKEREKAVREANRILRKNGYLVTVFPYQVIEGRENNFLQGLNLAGFDIVPELTGHVKAIEPDDSDFRVYVATAKKAREPSDNEIYIPFNIDFSRIAKGKKMKFIKTPPQSTVDVCDKFAFYDPAKGLEGLEERLWKYKRDGLEGLSLADQLLKRFGNIDNIPESELARIGYERIFQRGIKIIRPKK
ncbi:MAG: SNF2-related protein [Candidatus Aenigmarchaeota archaeon]|nr:SNF2-related protein [Candidatus Aenigmarchaeota archaeon]